MNNIINKIITDPNLGKVQDKFIAQKYKVTVSRVHAIRHKLKIPAYRKHSFHKSGTKLNYEKVVPLLGTTYDVKIAKKYKVSKERIRQLRNKYNIPVFKKESNNGKIII